MTSSEGTADYSVAIPAYGRPELLRETVRAALAQQFPSDMKWEVLVNDDCSEPRLSDALREFEGQIRLCRNETNAGWPDNWNRTLRLARGRWVHMLHSDDIVDRQFAPVMWRIVQQCPDAVLIHSLTRSVAVGRPPLARLYSLVRGHRPPSDDPDVGVGVYRSGIEAARHALRSVRATTAVVRRDAALSVGGMRQDLRNPSDEEYFVRLALKGDVAFCPRFLVTYRYNNNQDSQPSWINPGFIGVYRRVQEESLRLLGSDASEKDLEVINARIANAAGAAARAQAIAGNLKAARESIRIAIQTFGPIAEDPEFKKARMLVSNPAVRFLYRHLFV
jgi:glycosyltransferase involved in cell wall biosynthesis